MNANIIQTDYSVLQQIATIFERESDDMHRLVNDLNRRAEALRSGGWKSQGANAFYAEMDTQVMPALKRLVRALHSGGQTTRQLAELYRQAEEEARRLFEGSAGETAPMPGVTPGSGGSDSSPLTNILPILTRIVKGVKALGTLDIIKKIPVLKYLAPVLEALCNPDGDWLQSIGSTAIKAVGMSLLGEAFPPVAVATAASDLLQLIGMFGRPMEKFGNNLIATSADMPLNMNSITDRYYNNIERLDLGRIINPVADAIYDFTIKPYTAAISNAWQNPSANNLLRLGATIIGGGINPTFAFIASPEAQRAVGGDLGNLARGLGNFIYGAVDLQSSMLENVTARTVAISTRVNDILPIPPSWKQAMDDHANWFIERINKGFTPWGNLPVVPIL